MREAAADFVALLTPVVKALFTDLGFEVLTLGAAVGLPAAAAAS